MLTSLSKQGMYSVIPGDSVYSKNGAVQHSVTTGYGTDGRISSAGFTHGGASKNFGYEYHRGSTLVAQRTYTYDILGRPTARNTARQGSVVNDTFVHNSRSELAEATVSAKDYEYTYDNIGNRTAAVEDSSGVASRTEYTANQLNQYTAIAENGAAAFVPQFDTYGWDLTKNICEVFGPAGYIRTTYTYSPFGKVTASGDVTQPIQWSSEFYDAEPALVYYNYRHYNPTNGRWLGRDKIGERENFLLYKMVGNNPIHNMDVIGNAGYTKIACCVLRNLEKGDVDGARQCVQDEIEGIIKNFLHIAALTCCVGPSALMGIGRSIVNGALQSIKNTSPKPCCP